ncbi:hypothetical protein [Massilia sp. METH4]|uniref:hypothetical protein n=1 Tax=Massilia sp. METH4 TaxID=3123041 RepID=UPI0030D5C8C7
MVQSAYLPDQLVPAALKEAGLEPAVVDDVVGRMDETQFEAATSLLLTVLDSEEAAGRVTAVDPATRQPRPLHGAEEGQSVAFDVTGSFKESFFPIAGLVATFIATDRPNPADVPHAADALKAFWTKLIALTPRQDDDALAVARAVGTLATRATHAYSELAPSSADIASETGLSGPELVAALKRLCDLGVLANVEWGGEPGDLKNPGNRWRLTA